MPHFQDVPPLSFRVAAKGGISVYGLGRYPVTLYVDQWDRLLGQLDQLRAFIEASRAQLPAKPEAWTSRTLP